MAFKVDPEYKRLAELGDKLIYRISVVDGYYEIPAMQREKAFDFFAKLNGYKSYSHYLAMKEINYCEDFSKSDLATIVLVKKFGIE